MSGILRLESLTKGNTLKQGDKTPLKYRLFDADGEKLSVAGKSAKVRLVYPDFLTIGYERDGLTVAQDDTVTFTIDRAIPARIYHVEIIVDNQFVFPSRADEAKFTVDKSSLGADANIIEIVGKEVLIQAVKSQVDTELQPLVTTLESAQQAETQRLSDETVRVSAEAQRKIDHANRSAELAGKADKVVLKNLIENGNFNDGLTGWQGMPTLADGVTSGGYRIYQAGTSTVVGGGHKYYMVARVRAENKNEPTPLAIGFNGAINIVKIVEDTEWNTISIVTNSIGNGVFIVTSNAMAKNINIDTTFGIILIDLTATFGAGNEPTKEEMDRLIEITGYIDGEYALNNKEMFGYLMKGISEKANKKQEDWITPTLLNGAIGTVQFRKNQMGRVEFRGRLTMTNQNEIFRIPLGYRPNDSVLAVLQEFPSGATNRRIAITPAGLAFIYGSSEIEASLESLSYPVQEV